MVTGRVGFRIALVRQAVPIVVAVVVEVGGRWTAGLYARVPVGVGSEGARVQHVLDAVVVGVALADRVGHEVVGPVAGVLADFNAALVSGGGGVVLADPEQRGIGLERAAEVADAVVVLDVSLCVGVACGLQDCNGGVAEPGVRAPYLAGAGPEHGARLEDDEVQRHVDVGHLGLSVQPGDGLQGVSGSALALEDAREVVRVARHTQWQAVRAEVELVVGFIALRVIRVRGVELLFRVVEPYLLAHVGGGVQHFELREEAVATGAADEAQHGDGRERGHVSAVGHVSVPVDPPLRRREVDGSAVLEVGGVAGICWNGLAVGADADAEGGYDVRVGARRRIGDCQQATRVECRLGEGRIAFGEEAGEGDHRGKSERWAQQTKACEDVSFHESPPIEWATLSGCRINAIILDIASLSS